MCIISLFLCMLPLSVVVVVVDICLLLSMYFNKKYEKKTEKMKTEN